MIAKIAQFFRVRRENRRLAQEMRRLRLALAIDQARVALLILGLGEAR